MSILHRGESKNKLGIKMVGVVLIVVIIIVGAFKGKDLITTSQKKVTVISAPTLEKIVKESKISTFTAVYNGIAEVPDEKNPDEIYYYVRYEARVNAGFDLEQLQLEVVDKTIQVTIPPITLDKPNVDITSFDRMNVNKKDNLSELNGNEYRICEEDAERESEQKQVIKDLARQNAESVIRSLLTPFLDEEHTGIVFMGDAS